MGEAFDSTLYLALRNDLSAAEFVELEVAKQVHASITGAFSEWMSAEAERKSSASTLPSAPGAPDEKTLLIERGRIETMLSRLRESLEGDAPPAIADAMRVNAEAAEAKLVEIEARLKELRHG